MVGGLDYQEYWGNFFYEEIEGRKYETFWPDFIRKSSSSCFPLLLSQEFKEFVNYK